VKDVPHGTSQFVKFIMYMSEKASEHTSSIFDDPPQDKWAEHQVIEHGEVVDRFSVPFTQTELDSIMRARKAMLQPDFIRGVANGGPEREYNSRFSIPYQHGLDNRRRTIEMLQLTEQEADAILKSGIFTPGLNSRQAVVDIKDALALFQTG